MVRFGAGALAAPLVGLGGAGTMLPLGVVVLVSTACAALALRRVARARPVVGGVPVHAAPAPVLETVG